MRAYSPTTAAYFAARASFHAHNLIWFKAKNRTTGADETIGFWTGDDHAVFTIGGETRTYFGAGTMAKFDPLRRQVGVKARTQRVSFSQVVPEFLQLIRTYDERHAPVEIHRALFDPLSELLIDEPHLIQRGFVDKAKFPTPPKGGMASASIEIATHARALTKTLSRYRSDATLRARSSGDAIRQYASISEAVDTPWGRA
ncbi:hypothetical protein [Pseudorhodobacter sp.]|uniref:hypothetical protein n=1 Tax=Pseudorhodobacter sp. TaxID=1934400 RepID=UPI0026491D53|nr:hypothetical protein [Pseudorhodobacter sp.]MDN5786401.1 hypothetical protein [Pseudorhodobacter sp.]